MSADYHLLGHFIGADASAAGLKWTTIRETTLYVSPTGTAGARRGAGVPMYGTGVKVGDRRMLNITPGGADYWVPADDVRIAIDIEKAPAPASPAATSATPASAPSSSPVLDPYREKVSTWLSRTLNEQPPPANAPVNDPARKRWSIAILVAVATGVLGLGAAAVLLFRGRWGWALADLAVTPAAAAGAGAIALKMQPVGRPAGTNKSSAPAGGSQP